MNCLYITLFFNIVAGIVQTFIKSWQLLYPQVIEVCCLPFEPCHDFLHFVMNVSPSFGEFTAPLCHISPIHNVTINSNNLFVNFHWMFTFCIEKSYDGTHLTFGGTLDRQCCRTKHKKFPYRPTRDVSLLSRHASYISIILIKK
jgi:hypothetical protein